MRSAQVNVNGERRSRPSFIPRLLLSTFLIVIASDTGWAQPVEGGGGGLGGGAPFGNNFLAMPAGETGTPDEGETPGTGGLTGFLFTKSAVISETYSSNGLGTSGGLGISGGGRGGADWITRLSLLLGLSDHRARFEADVTYNLSGYLYANNDSLDRVTNNLNGIVRSVLVPEHLELQARAFAAPVLINQFGPLSSSGLPTANSGNSGLRNTYGYSLAPDAAFRLGSFARSDTTFMHSAIFFDQPGGSSFVGNVPGQSSPLNSVSVGVSERIASGSYFNRLNWNILGSYNKANRNRADITESAGIADIKYAVSRSFAFVATGGYQSIESQTALTTDLSGPTALGGGQVTLGPNFSMSVRAGKQFEFTSYIGDIHFQITPATGIVGSLTDTVTTPAQRLLNNLNFLSVDTQGNLFDSQYEFQSALASGFSAFDPAPVDQLSIDSNISRYRSANVSLLHSGERTQYRLTGYRTVRDILTSLSPTISPRQESTGVLASVSRALRPNLSGVLSTTYTMYDLGGSQTEIFLSSLTFNYIMNPQMQLFVSGAYLKRDTDNTLATLSPLSSSLSDGSVTVGLRRQF